MPHRRLCDEEDAEKSLQFTEHWWRNWSSRCTHQTEWREAVLRSLITLIWLADNYTLLGPAQNLYNLGPASRRR